MTSTPHSPDARLTVTSSINQGARDYQEDACGHWYDDAEKRLFAVVADGAGGHGGGAEAAQAALRVAESAWKSKNHAKPEDFLKTWMENAHEAVNQAGKAIQRSARAVAVACLTDGRNAYWVHAGDSRLIHFRDGELLSRTRDDSVVQVLFEQGEIREEEMGTHPDQSRLLQSLGGDEAPTPRLGNAELQPGDVLILCSDGFWEHLRTHELEKLVATPRNKRDAALAKAVDLAVRRGGAKADNTTAIMIHCDDGGCRRKPPLPLWLLWILLILTFGSVGAWWATRQTWWPRHASEHGEIQDAGSTQPKESITDAPPFSLDARNEVEVADPIDEEHTESPSPAEPATRSEP